MMQELSDISEFLERLAPLRLAESWDNVGLLIGDRASEVSRVMTCLSVTPSTVSEAVARRAELIVTHHPVLFRAVKRLTSDDPQTGALLELVRAGTAVYSAHTAFDSAKGGINEMLAGRLGLSECQPLRCATAPAGVKLVVFVPDTDLAALSKALFDQGAGTIGKYSECSFRLAGQGTFRGSAASHPAVGQAQRRELVDEWRLEMVCPPNAIARVVSALRAAHSYEEPAFDIYPLAGEILDEGTGRYGVLAKPAPLTVLADRVKDMLACPFVLAVGDPQRPITRVAVACGSAAGLLQDARSKGCHLFLTGEATFHRQLEAQAAGVSLILAGHYATERFAVEELARRVHAEFPDLEVWPSQQEHDPAWRV